MLSVEDRGSVRRVRLNRPEVRNAFNEELIAQLTLVFTELPTAIRVVLLSGEGKSFCAGGDLEWMRRAASYSEEENFRDALKLAELYAAIVHCPALTIAQVHGAAFGGGCGLVAAVDVALASPETQFAFSEVRLGLIPGTISAVVIPKIGPGHARALFATGEAFGTERALRIGLIHEVGDLEELTQTKLKPALAVGPRAVAEAKRLVHEAPLTLDETARRLAQTRATDEAREGIAAFLDRRTASFVEAPLG